MSVCRPFPHAERDSTFLCVGYNVTPLNLQIQCNKCGTTFKVNHTLICGKEGLVNARHNKAYEELIYIAQRDFPPASVFAEPLIHKIHTRSEREICQGGYNDKKKRGDVMIKGLLDQQADAIVDVKLGDADAYYYKYESTEALLDRW